MPILAMDQMGRIYQTSGDREDGLGFGSYPEPASQSDTTLGNAYLKAQERRTQELLNRKRAQAEFDRQERERVYKANQVRRVAQARENAKAEIMQHPEVQNAVLKQAVTMGCNCEYLPTMNGGRPSNGLTANGQSGWAGMNRDQQIIHHAITGMGRNVAPGPGRMENGIVESSKRLNDHLRQKAIPVGPSPATRYR